MRVNAMNNTVQTLDVDIKLSTSKIMKWSLANWHVGKTVELSYEEGAQFSSEEALFSSVEVHLSSEEAQL